MRTTLRIQKKKTTRRTARISNPRAKAKEPVWRGLGGKKIVSGANFGLMAIVNLTPDSFYDGGKLPTTDAVITYMIQALENGATILDIGGESTRPGAAAVDPASEWARVESALRAATKLFPETPVSLDTRSGECARKALELGAAIVNDVSSFDYDPALRDVLIEYRPAYVLTHNRGLANAASPDKPQTIVAEIKKFFDTKLNELARAGLPEDRVALDPGVGFGKTWRENLAILAKADEFREFNRPLLAGVSMKSFFGHFLGLSPDRRGSATVVTCALLWQKGFFWHRVHDVAETRNALLLAEALSGDKARERDLA